MGMSCASKHCGVYICLWRTCSKHVEQLGKFCVGKIYTRNKASKVFFASLIGELIFFFFFLRLDASELLHVHKTAERGTTVFSYPLCKSQSHSDTRLKLNKPSSSFRLFVDISIRKIFKRVCRVVASVRSFIEGVWFINFISLNW